MVQAAALGLVDFSKMEFFNQAWQTRLRLILDGLHTENRRRITEASLAYHTGLLALSRITQDSSNRVQERCQEDLRELINLLQPWEAKTKEESERDQVKTYRDRWQNRWGDMDSPEIQSKIAEVAEGLARMRELDPAPDELATRYGVFNAQTAEALSGIKDRM